MTEGKDIWDQKPDSIYKDLQSYGHYYGASSMDAWLEKMKVSFDESMADCHHSLEIITKRAVEYREKAEKHDEVKAELDRFTFDVDKELERLEAVKTWFDELPAYTVSHLCTVLVPFEDETVSQERTLYTVLKEILGVEQ